MSTVVSVKNVTKEFPLGDVTVKALRGVSLEIEEGKFSVVTGPSGSGKTTLLNLIGLLDSPTAGEILIDGKEVGHLPEKEKTLMRRHTLGFIFQHFNLIPVLDVYENIELGFFLRDLPAKEVEARILEVSEQVGLMEYIRHRPDQLSGGQRQRVAIARALAPLPRVVLTDEPTANLDSQTGKEILDIMKDLSRKKGMTFIFSTHDADISRLADRRIEIKDGLVEKIYDA